MGNYMLCTKPMAGTPYYIEKIQVNLYSIEELVWFLSNNIAIADTSVINHKLAIWLKNECRMEDEAARLDSILMEDGRECDALKWLFKCSHYFNQTQLQKLDEKIDEFRRKGPMEKRKVSADMLMSYGKVRQAEKEYEHIARMTGISQSPKGFQASVNFNRGCAYAKLFQIKKAYECFCRAYELLPDETSKNALLYIAYLDGGKAEFENMAQNIDASPSEKENVLRNIASLNVPAVDEDTSVVMREWIRQYHERTGL